MYALLLGIVSLLVFLLWRGLGEQRHKTSSEKEHDKQDRAEQSAKGQRTSQTENVGKSHTGMRQTMPKANRNIFLLQVLMSSVFPVLARLATPFVAGKGIILLAAARLFLRIINCGLFYRNWTDWYHGGHAQAQSHYNNAGGYRSSQMSLQAAYEILGLRPGANEAEINEAYRRVMKHTHPDQGGDASNAARVNVARDTLLQYVRATK